MAALPVITYGEPILRKVLEIVEDFDAIQDLVPDMFDTMYEEEGIGLAASQIGVDLNLMIIDISHADQNHPPAAYVNGQIIDQSGSISLEEGCLSIPEVRVDVTRSEKVIFAYQDLGGNHHEAEFDDLMATVIQHEMDHLNGRLIIDHASQLDKHRIRKQLKELVSHHS
ncbi:MAG TPA: peptide deformylase [Candidatus Marinimicrobia bacterium]|jgi:peptide deformylase|nr:peptide deformylase [Candidatus Neomarinimicrobiota bacterium]HHZ98744.1 peptide deformylase [Candidatus Neomarinimicrobiota bacterium]HIB03751.1 peptide deformylase [Candidatus Neomarinimicrobiota bacterium]HIB70276.1 peptide deformylase [Candidatus Neomarinimicrobiota bacterium]HIB95307.1 peptide deformylase [Candidatus Neomarinimicrobiota bacterium]